MAAEDDRALTCTRKDRQVLTAIVAAVIAMFFARAVAARTSPPDASAAT